MGEIRIPRKNGEYVIPKEKYLTAVHYCRQYKDWLREYRSLGGEPRALQYDGSIGGSSQGNPTEKIGIRRMELSQKIQLIQDTVYDVDPGIYKWLLKGVTEKGITATYLKKKLNMPCSEEYYYKRRQEVLKLISDKI